MIIFFRLKEQIRHYLQERFFLVILVLILFVMGIIFGGVSVKIIEKWELDDLVSFVNQGLQGEVLLPNSLYTKQVILSNIQMILFLFFMGVSVIGVPLALLVVFTRGFMLGFSTGFLLNTMGFKGFVLAIIGILPHNLLLVPALLLMVIATIDCAAALTKIRFTAAPMPLNVELFRCSVLTVISLIIISFSGLIQGYVSPLLTEWLIKAL